MTSDLAGRGSLLFLAGACLGATVAAAGYYFVGRSHSTRTDKHRPFDRGSAGSSAQHTFSLNDEVVGEQLSRNLHFFGRDAMQKIASSRVAVVGLGGVGSHAAHLLLRSGVGSLVLMDFDQVCSWRRCAHPVTFKVFKSTRALPGVQPGHQRLNAVRVGASCRCALPIARSAHAFHAASLHAY